MPDPITRSVLAALEQTLADHIGPQEALARSEENVAGLEVALESRTMIGTAIGLVMAQRGLTARAAYEHLVETSMHTNVKLREIAAEIVQRANEAVGGEPETRGT